MMTMSRSKSELEKLAADHWDYSHALIKEVMQITAFAYQQAFIHGYKHAVEDVRSVERGEREPAM